MSVEDWAEIRRLHRAERMPAKVIARVLGCSKNTVKKALAADQPPGYRRRSRGSVVDASEPRIRELLQACPTMPATVIAERIEWPYSIRTLSTRVAELRPVYVPPDPASRTSYLVGEIAQCDFWFPPVRLPVGFRQTRTAAQLPVVTASPAMPVGLGLVPSAAPGLVCRLGGADRAAGGDAAGAGVGR